MTEPGFKSLKVTGSWKFVSHIEIKCPEKLNEFSGLWIIRVAGPFHFPIIAPEGSFAIRRNTEMLGKLLITSLHTLRY